MTVGGFASQCVASRGVRSKVRAITRSTSASVILRGAPGRGSSNNPGSRFWTKRCLSFAKISSHSIDDGRALATGQVNAPGGVAHLACAQKVAIRTAPRR
jgi:hypothetical protein